MSRPEVQRVMNQMRAGLGVHCNDCHVKGDAANDAKPQKARARDMMRMVIDLNNRHFGGQPVVTCFTCHNGKREPAVTPPLPQPVPVEPAAVEAKTLPQVASVIQKYVAAVGRELRADTPRLLTGTHRSPTGPPIPVTIAEAGESVRVELQLPDGTTVIRTTDATSGWVSDKNGVRDLSSEDWVGARMGRRPFVPFYTSDLGDGARVVGSEEIDQRNVWVVANPTSRYYFDAETGLLRRRVVYYSSPVGRIPEQTDFADYRDVGGVNLPFLARVALVDPWLGGTQQAETIQIERIAPPVWDKPANK